MSQSNATEEDVSFPVLKKLPEDLMFSVLEWLPVTEIISSVPRIDKRYKNTVYAIRKFKGEQCIVFPFPDNIKKNFKVFFGEDVTEEILDCMKLLLAVYTKDIYGVMYIMENIDVNVDFSKFGNKRNGFNIVSAALHINIPFITKYLLHSPKCSEICEDGNLLLTSYIEAKHDNEETLRYILSHCDIKKDINSLVSHSDTQASMLMYASSKNMIKTVRIFIENDVYIDYNDGDGHSVLHWAVSTSNGNPLELVKLLVGSGCNGLKSSPYPAYMLAMVNHNLDAAEYLARLEGVALYIE